MLILGATNDNGASSSDNFGVKHPATPGWRDITVSYDGKTNV